MKETKMAVQVAGTTVIDDSRNANNIVNITATGSVQSASVLATSYNENFVSLSGTSPTIDCSAGNVFGITTSGTTTFSFSNVPSSGRAYGFTLDITAGGTHSLNWPSSVKFAGGTAPDAPASGETDVYGFYTRDGGTNWYGFLAGDAMS